MSESGKVVVTKSKLDGLANAINDKAQSPGPKTIAQLTKTVNDMKTGGSSVFLVTLTTPSYDGGHYDSNVTADKTFAEILAAYQNGDIIRAKWGSWILDLMDIGDDYATFATCRGSTNTSTELASVTALCTADIADSWEIGSWNNNTPSASTTAPQAPGTATAGASLQYARSDHVHPTELFVCNITKNSNDYTCDKTFAEILEAYNAGKVCIAKYVEDGTGTHICYLVEFYSVQQQRRFTFSNIVGTRTTSSNQRSIRIAVTMANTVSVNEYIVSGLPQAIKITLPIADWNTTAKTQSVTVPGVLSDATKQKISIMPVNAALDSPYASAGVQCVAQAADSLTFGCDTVPTEAIDVYVEMYNVNLLFSATITVHVKSGVYVTLLKGSTTIGSKESTGTAVFTVMETGTYRVVAATESSSMSKQVDVISSQTAYEVIFDNFG